MHDPRSRCAGCFASSVVLQLKVEDPLVGISGKIPVIVHVGPGEGQGLPQLCLVDVFDGQLLKLAAGLGKAQFVLRQIHVLVGLIGIVLVLASIAIMNLKKKSNS